MRYLFAVILTLLTACAHAQGLAGSAGTTCPYGTALGDGCPQAPIGGSTIHPDFFTGYAANSGQTYVSAPFTGAINGSGLLTISGVSAGTSATASWASGATSITVPSGLGLVAGYIVYDTTLGQAVGVIQSYSGTTLALKPPYAMAASSGSTDALTFKVIATNSETIQGAGIPAGVYISSLGTGTGGNGTYHLANAGSLPLNETMTAVRRPSWNVAGVDYAVGAATPTGGFQDPATASLGPNCVYSATGNGGNPQVACYTSFTIKNLEFGPIGGHASTRLLIQGSSLTATGYVINNDWGNDGVVNITTANVWLLDEYNAPPKGQCLDIENNTFNGNWYTIQPAFGVFAQSYGCTIYRYNAVLNTPGRPTAFVASGYDGIIMQSNYGQGWLNQGDAQGHGEFIVPGNTGTGITYRDVSYNTFLQTVGSQTAPVFGLTTGSTVYPDTSDQFHNNVGVAQWGCGLSCSPTGGGLGGTICNIPAPGGTCSGVGDVFTVTAIGGGGHIGLGNEVTTGSNLFFIVQYYGQNTSIGTDPNGLGSQWLIAATSEGVAFGNCSGGICVTGTWGANISISGATWSVYQSTSSLLELNNGNTLGVFNVSNNFMDPMGASSGTGLLTLSSGLTCTIPVTVSGNVDMRTGAPMVFNTSLGTGC